MRGCGYFPSRASPGIASVFMVQVLEDPLGVMDDLIPVEEHRRPRWPRQLHDLGALTL